MNNEPRYYVPCLRWKQGEYQAVLRLSADTRKILRPIIEVPEIGYDFENRRDIRTIDEHVSSIARRVREKWGIQRCFVDMHLIESLGNLITGQHPFTYVFDGLRLEGVSAIPMVNLEQGTACENAIAGISAVDKRGVCIRISLEEAAKHDIAASIEGLLRLYNIGADECDFVLDLGAPNFVPIGGLAGILESIIVKLPHRDDWRSLTLIGTSFPRSMGEVRSGVSIIPRNEWLLYTLLIEQLGKSGTRIPAFGDYVINHPVIPALDMRFVKPFASVRYTIDNAYLIVKGRNVRDYKFDQYRGLCGEVTRSRHYRGQSFSEGDKYIYGCAHGTESTGRLTTWRWVGTNHHLEQVAGDIANLSFS